MIKYLLLYPITLLFSVVVYVRNALYDWGVLSSVNSKLPIISIGNIQVGGTGKTPFVIALSKKLIQNNIKPIIITRGYKRNTKNQIILDNHKKYLAQEVGDEPYYMKQELINVIIIVDNNKKNAIKTANKLNGVDCILMDDGFQSRYINRNIDVVLTSFTQVKNFSLIPFGSFREPISSLKRADFIYKTKDGNAKKNNLKINFMCHEYKKGAILKNAQKEPVDIISKIKSPVVAFCGIANSTYFINTLKELEINVEKEINFENHTKYDAKKYAKLKKINPNNLSFITTYKDFVKLDQSFINNYTIYVIVIKFELNDDKLINQIKQLINEN